MGNPGGARQSRRQPAGSVARNTLSSLVCALTGLGCTHLAGSGQGIRGLTEPAAGAGAFRRHSYASVEERRETARRRLFLGAVRGIPARAPYINPHYQYNAKFLRHFFVFVLSFGIDLPFALDE